MSEVPTQDQALKEPEPDVTIEEIEEQITNLFNQMTSLNKNITLLGKRIREETLPDIEAFELEYLSLPDPRPSWFQFIAEQAESKKFAHATRKPQSNTQNGHT